MLLLLPTVVLLGLFIAYPFVKGIELSVTDTKVGIPGHFVGLQNFRDIWNDSIFRIAVWNTCLYTAVATVFKLALGLWLAGTAQQQLQRQGVHSGFYFIAVYYPNSAFYSCLEMDV